MKWLRTMVLFDQGDLVSTTDWNAVHESYVRSIQSIDFPIGSGSLTLRKKTRRGKTQWSRNGVKYLRTRFFDHLVKAEGWKPEKGFDLGEKQDPPELILYPSLDKYQQPISSRFGDIDFVTETENGLLVAIEWETGNISSSHRSMNKLAIALESGQVQAGVLIVPTRSLYDHLTDRVGNIGELSGYLSMWKALGAGVQRGLLAVTVVEHDALTTDTDFPYLPTGKDGRASEGSAKD